MEQQIFYRRAKKLGNSAGVLLPKKLLGADVKITVLRRPRNVKRDVVNILEPVLPGILGIYLTKEEPESEKKQRQFEILVVSTKLKKAFQKLNYRIDIVPLEKLKKSIKQKKEAKERIKQAKPILNNALLEELKKI